MPSNCAGGQVSGLHLESQGLRSKRNRRATSAKYTTPTGATGCANVPFNPEIAVTADGPKAVDSPEATTVDVGIPWNPEAPIANSYLKVAKVTLPEGMGINPSAGNTITSCSDAQFGYHTASTVTCPAASQIGTVNIETPSLPSGSITGEVYVGEPLKNGPGAFESGEQFRIFIYAHSVRYGVNVRLEGKVFPNATTGQLTAVVPENPQATFRNFRLHFNGGDNGVLTSASTCGTNTTTTEFTPWSENPDNNKPTTNTSLTSVPGGGTCPTSLGARKYTPGYTAATESTTAAQFSPFKIHIGRNDGEQEIKAVNVTLPKGLVGRLAGIPYCGEAELAAAAASSGKAQQAKASCSSESAIGTAVTSAGTGGKPLTLNGTVYLTGPYKGAPLGLAVVTPAVAGPFDLGTVVVRAALNVNPATAQINAVSDPIPNVFGGVKLDVRSIDLNMNRYKFMLNPTNCAKGATAGTLSGGGSNPANASNWTSYAISAAFQATACNKLAFKPTFHARISGPTTRAKNPQIRVVVQAKSGQANIARTALNLPHSLFLDQSHIKTNCTRVQLAAQAVPAELDLRLRRSELAAAQAEVEGSGLPGVLEAQASGPPGGPQRPDQHPARRRHQLQPRRAEDGVQRNAGRAAEVVHPQHEGRRKEPPAELGKPLQEISARGPQHEGPERQDGQEQQVPSEHLILREQEEVEPWGGRGCAPARQAD